MPLSGQHKNVELLSSGKRRTSDGLIRFDPIVPDQPAASGGEIATLTNLILDRRLSLQIA
jgi:hypothetical protein